MFGLAIHNLEGMLVTGPNTREAGMVPDRIDGDGVVDLTIDRLMLLPGTYDISASLYDYAIVHPFDFRQRALRFDVDAGDPARDLRRRDVARRPLDPRPKANPVARGGTVASRARRPAVAALVDATGDPAGVEADRGRAARAWRSRAHRCR